MQSHDKYASLLVGRFCSNFFFADCLVLYWLLHCNGPRDRYKTSVITCRSGWYTHVLYFLRVCQWQWKQIPLRITVRHHPTRSPAWLPLTQCSPVRQTSDWNFYSLNLATVAQWIHNDFVMNGVSHSNDTRTSGTLLRHRPLSAILAICATYTQKLCGMWCMQKPRIKLTMLNIDKSITMCCRVEKLIFIWI